MSASPVRAFLSYAHEDAAWRDRVLKQLGWLVNSGQLQAFDDRQIKPGEQWDPRIRAELEAASIIIVLISEHFVGSRYCTIEELVRAVERQHSGAADLVAIYCDWVDVEALPIASHQVLPQDEHNDLKPLSAWTDREASLPLSRIAAAVRRMVQDRRPAAAAPAPSATPTGLPPLGRFVGRETDLDQLRAWLLDRQRQPIALLGPGGIGKSKLSIAALHDAAVAAHFSDRRLFVSLTDVRDEAGIHAAILRELGREPGPQPFAALAIALGGIPSLVVLDNAETPWEADLPGAEQAFARLAELPGITLVASLRGYQLPGIADWRPILIEPLPPDPARTLFLAIAGAAFARDADLPTLLARLDGLPLAIELIAHRAQTEPDLATLLRRWDAERTAFVQRGQGGRKDLDLAISIAISLDSPRMTDSGRRLFALLGRLPHGLARDDLRALMQDDGEAAAGALHATGLVLPDPQRLRLLAPIRDHAADQPLPDHEAAALAAHFAALASSLPRGFMQPADRAAAARARAELPNIEAVLGLQDSGDTPVLLARRASQWVGVGDARRTLGSIALAEQAYLQAHRIISCFESDDPENSQWRRDLAISWNRIGDVRTAQGDLTSALYAYTESKNIRERLAQADPGNAEWQRSLSVSWSKLGDVRTAQGDLSSALQAFTECKNIRERLTKGDPSRIQWQFDLGISYERIGNTLTMQGYLDAAVESYLRKQAIAERLVKADPHNPHWQRDLAISWNKLGDIRTAQGNQSAAIRAYTESKNIRERLAKADPSNVLWQRDLYISWSKLGDLCSAFGDLMGALQAFTEGKNIIDKLTATDPCNAEWQRDLSICWEKLGEMQFGRGNKQAALLAFTASKNIREKLARADWSNAQLQRDLAVSWDKVGDVRTAENNLTGALHAYGESKSITDRLVQADPSNALWQRDLIVSLVKLAEIATTVAALQEAVRHYDEALRIARELAVSARLEAVVTIPERGVLQPGRDRRPGAGTGR